MVDGDDDKKLDPQKVSLPIKRDSEDVVVFITTLPSARQNYESSEKVDLTIKTEDHLLPWVFFCKNVGNEFLHSSTAIQRIAVQIVEKCGGHLLAIVLTAKSLKGVKDVQIWELALKNLCYHDREPIVNAFFNIIWANVTSEREKLIGSKKEAKSILQNFMECFVLLQFEDTLGRYILLPEDIKIILRAFGGNIPKSLSEGVLASAISNLQVPNLSNTHIQNLYAPNTLPPQLKELNLEGCMFETLPEAEPQKLEALSLENYSQLLELPPEINKLENVKKLMLAGCKRLETLPQIWELQDLEVCDLSDTLITHLPRFTNLPKLRILLLRDNDLNLMTIPSSFFNHVPLLSILDLSCTSIHELPSSLFNLQELREFYLNHCELFLELPAEIKRLKNLTTLDLDGTLITHLPKEIEELTNLESISLSFYNDDSSFAVVPLDVLSKLTHLKVLKIGINSDNEWWFNNVEHILAEINGLKLLQALDIYIPRVNFLNPIKRHLSNFRLVIGYHKPRMISRVPPSFEVIFKESCPRLKFVNGQDFSDEVKFILSKSWAFFLDRHMKINNLAQFGLKNLKKLRLCILA
ncbi:disease resistance protein RPS2-like isoform X2 [Neltuma alba]|uniref:disease resistance protein RPS2-like isoform X2 n=1 Tax=Neltuma alba TaxID=207710 RepID=UPI0010A2B757|nr:disease resistance protein RPS2-like isoform X2 [Prosopis alba]